MAGFCMLQLVQDIWSGCWRELFTGSDVSQRKLPPHSGQTISGNPPGSVGGNASTTISSTQSVWLQERQRYLYQLLGLGLNSRNSSHIGSVILLLMRYFLKQLIFFDDTVLGMINQLQQHFVIAFRTGQRVFPKAVKEPLLKRLGRQYSVAVGVLRHVGRYNIGQLFSHFLIPYVSVKTIISDSLKSLWHNMLSHPSNKSRDRECLVFNLAGFVVTIPVSDRFAVISFYPSYRDGRRDNIFCQILSEPLSTGRHLTWLKESDKTLWIIFPCPIYIFFNGRVANIFSEHFQKMILPLFVHHLVGNVRDRQPLSACVNPSCGHQDMQMGIVMTGSSGSLKHDDVSDVKLCASASLENIFEAGMAGSHEAPEQLRITKEPEPKKFRHSQYYMSISYAGKKSSGDELRPSVGIDLGTGKTKARLAGESNASYLAAVAASILNKSHFIRVAAIEHFLDCIIIIGTVKFGIGMLKRIPVIVENLLECVFVNAFHDRSLRTIITEMTR